MMLPIQHSTTCLTLLAVCFMLIGIGCGDSDDDEVLIEEEAEPPVVTIIDDWTLLTKRPDAEILADKILRRETEGFFFDLPRRNQLIGEIERVLSLIRAAYPPMNEIHAEEEVVPGVLVIYPEPDFYEMLKEMIEDKQGQIRFETGYAEFDALNAKLGLQKILLGDPISDNLIFYFKKHLNHSVAREAYSMVEGVQRVSVDYPIGIDNDITAFKYEETWNVTFWHGWGDCPSGCLYEESFCFSVTGAHVEQISK